MVLSAVKWQVLYGSLARRLLLRSFLFVLAMAIFPYLQTLDDMRKTEFGAVDDVHDCPLLDGSSNPHLLFKTGLLNPTSSFGLLPPEAAAGAMLCKEFENLTRNVFKELMDRNFLDSKGKALSVGVGSTSAILALRGLGLSNAFGVERHPFFSLLRRRFVYELSFKDNSFDFVFSRALDRVSVPALFVLEVERVLRPGGVGAMLVRDHNFYSGSLIRSATPVSSFLKSSNVVQVCGVSTFALIIFKKRFDSLAYFDKFHLPQECPSIKNSESFLKYLEPLSREIPGKMGTHISYLPEFINVSSRNRLIHINIGAGEYLNSSITNWLRPMYSKLPQASNVYYVIDHNSSVLSSYVKGPGITFVYHPGLAGNNKATASFNIDGDWSTGMPADHDFDFIAWFRKAVAPGDLVVVAMNAGLVELNLLTELFESGAICYVDELFLRCLDDVYCKNSVCGDCTGLFASLRNSGIFAHQWFGG